MKKLIFIIFVIITIIVVFGCSEKTTESSSGNGNNAEIVSPNNNDIFFVNESIHLEIDGNNIDWVGYQSSGDALHLEDTTSPFGFTVSYDENDIGNVTIYIYVEFNDSSHLNLNVTVKIIGQR